MADFAERTIDVVGSKLAVLEGGEGAPLLVLHDELGHPGWLAWHKKIAKRRRLIIPIQPGFRSERIKWLRNVRDLAAFYGFALREMGHAKVDVIGFSFGGWVAAEMAVNNPAQFGKMALVAPFGLKPSEGFIYDMFPVTSIDYLRVTVKDASSPEFAALYGEASAEQFERWEDARTEIARLAWEPYMHNLSLAPLLKGLKGLPTLIVWGSEDAVLPQAAVRAYEAAIPGAHLRVIQGAGHRPESEKADEFIRDLEAFLT